MSKTGYIVVLVRDQMGSFGLSAHSWDVASMFMVACWLCEEAYVVGIWEPSTESRWVVTEGGTTFRLP